MNQRVQTLEGGVAGAQSRADDAARKAEGVNSRLTRLWSNRFNQKTADSLEVYFSPDSIDLSDAAQTALTAVVNEMKAHPTLTVELGGYTDPRGALDYNYALSQRRVDTVRRFLMDRGIQLARIQAASLGPISSTDIPGREEAPGHRCASWWTRNSERGAGPPRASARRPHAGARGAASRGDGPARPRSSR